MANFNTHFAVGTAVSGVAASLCYCSELSSLPLSLGLWGLGTWGSLLPDVDSDNSIVVKLFFNGLAFAVMALVFFWLAPLYALPLVWGIVAVSYLLVRFPLMTVFKKFSRHRGVAHSILAAAFAGAFTAWAGDRVLDLKPLECWLTGAAVTLGYLVHLTLDECYSVDLHNTKLKKSFGTALKLFSLNNPGRSAIMAAGLAALVWYGPPLQSSLDTIRFTLLNFITTVFVV